MPKYLTIANYTADGVKGVLAKGGSARRTAVERTVTEAGGTVESFYFGFGDDDAYTIVDLPDNATAASIGLQVAASGMATARTVVLLAPEEVDRAAEAPPTYVPPGS